MLCYASQTENYIAVEGKAIVDFYDASPLHQQLRKGKNNFLFRKKIKI